MSWWNKNKKIILLIFTSLALLIGAIIISFMIFGPVINCTFVGCGGGINVELSDLPAATPYQIILSLPSGKTKTLFCGTGTEDNSIPFEKSCSSTGAFFSLEPDLLPPDEITVTVVVGGNRVSQNFHPVYEKFQPNGENCPPICYSATIKMNISQ